MGHGRFYRAADASNEGRNRMLLTLAIVPLTLGLIVVIMATIRKLKPEPVMEDIDAGRGPTRLDAVIRSDSEDEKVSLKN